MNVIESESLHVNYEGERVATLNGVDLEVETGEFICITGPNGAGKTTLLETILALLRPSRGNIRVFGTEPLKEMYRLRRRVGYMVQNFDIPPETPFLVRDVVLTGLVPKIGALRFPSGDDWNWVRHYLSLVGMGDFEHRPVGRMSGGEQQKVLLARALVSEPELLLLDEPLAHMDPESRVRVCRVLSDIHEEKNSTILMVSHSMDAVPEACSRVIRMEFGKITEDRTL